MFKRTGFVAVMFAVLWSTSCGSDDESSKGAAGKGGSAGATAGSGGTGGAGASGGSGGTSGSSGTAPDGAAAQAGTAGDASQSTLSVRTIDTYVTDTGNVEQAVDLSQYDLGVLVRSTNTFTSYGATVTAGGFEVRNLPAGPYYVRYQRLGGVPLYIVTSSMNLDLGRFYPGRPDTKTAQAATQLVFDVTGVSSWQTGDDLFLTSMGAGASLYGINDRASAGAAAAGDTQVAGLTIDYATYAKPPHLIDGSAGDRAWLLQLVAEPLGASGTYQSLEKALELPTFTQSDGQSTTLNGALADVAQSNLGLDFKVSQYEGALAAANPAAVRVSSHVDLVAQPQSDRGWIGIAPDVMYFDAPGSTDFVTTVSYGNPFPSSYGLILEGGTIFQRAYTVGSATGSIPLFLMSRIAPSSSSTLAPIVGPVQNFTIGGVDALSDRSGVGLQPSVSWSPPAIGTPDGYLLAIARLYDDAGTLRKVFAGALYTTDTSLVIPPNMLATGNTYVFNIEAFTAAGVDVASRPLVSGLPESSADVDSGLVTP